ncbi:hypothetical protein HYY75_08465, partial [bacterium]|nr:hypothetical protein [bacterium]
MVSTKRSLFFSTHFFTTLALFAILINPILAATRRSGNPPSLPPVEKEWTIMVFMAADNNLEAGTENDLNEMETIGSTNHFNILVQLDRNGKYSKKTKMKWTGTKRIFIKKDGDPKTVTSPIVQNLGEVDMASPKALTDFVQWAKKAYPAKRYALILWNHGTGWKEVEPDVSPMIAPLPSLIPQDFANSISYSISYDNTSGTSMNIPTMGETLKRVKTILGRPLDLLGFDACLMQMAEVAYEASPYALFQIASPDQEPEEGWPYDSILKELARAPTMDGKQLGKVIVTAYGASYQMGSQGNRSVTLSLFDLTKTRDFITALDDFSNSMIKNMEEVELVDKARDWALKYTHKDYVDLAHFCSLFSQQTKNPSVKKAIQSLLELIQGNSSNRFVIENAHEGEKFKESRGVSIFLPDRAGIILYENRYKLLSMSKNCAWFRFLEEYKYPGIPYLCITGASLDDENHDGKFTPGESVSVKLTIKNLGKKTLPKVELSCTTSSNFLEAHESKISFSDTPKAGKELIVPGNNLKIKPDVPLNSEIPLVFKLSGNGMPDSVFQISFYIRAPFSSNGQVLLVLTDSFSSASPVLQKMFQTNNVKFDLWDRMLDGELKPEVLKRYLSGWVYVSAQDSSSQQQISNSEIEALSVFLKSGGNIVLSGQDLAFSLRENPFLKNFCKIAFVQDDTNIHVMSGVNGFAGGDTFDIFGGDGANNQKWPDEIDPLQG